MQKGKHNPCEPHTRVHLLPVQPHHRLLALYALSDVVLDSLPTSGCTTTREALPPSSTDRRDPRQGCPRLRVCSVREAVPTHAAVPLSVHLQPNSHTLLCQRPLSISATNARSSHGGGVSFAARLALASGRSHRSSYCTLGASHACTLLGVSRCHSKARPYQSPEVALPKQRRPSIQCTCSLGTNERQFCPLDGFTLFSCHSDGQLCSHHGSPHAACFAGARNGPEGSHAKKQSQDEP